jgi:hypothetical protein
VLSGLGFCSPDKATAAVREPSVVLRVPGIHVTAQGGFIGLWRGNQRQKIKRPQQRALAGKKEDGYSSSSSFSGTISMSTWTVLMS